MRARFGLNATEREAQRKLIEALGPDCVPATDADQRLVRRLERAAERKAEQRSGE